MKETIIMVVIGSILAVFIEYLSPLHFGNQENLFRTYCVGRNMIEPIRKGQLIGKALSDMTLEELWELFPIILIEHKDIWVEWYAEEQRRLTGLLSSENIRISHIGSTAIDDIWAKPIIDILMELPVSLSMESVKEILVQNGYICMSEQPNRKSFNIGYTSEGFAEKVFHLHLRYWGDNDELYFRDYLNENPLLAKQYEELKLSLWKKFEHDRDGYTFAKTSFIAEQTDRAKKYYGNRHYTSEESLQFPALRVWHY